MDFPPWASHPFFEWNAIFAIARLIDILLHMDSTTASLKRPSIARIQVGLDILKDRPSKVWIATEGEDGFWQKIIYDNAPNYCCHCWHIGRSEASCHIQHPELKKDSR